MIAPLSREEAAECREALARLERQGFIRRIGGQWRSGSQSGRLDRILKGLGA